MTRDQVAASLPQAAVNQGQTVTIPYTVPDSSLTGEVEMTATLTFAPELQRVVIVPDEGQFCRFLLETTLGIYGTSIVSTDAFSALHQWQDHSHGNLIYFFINADQTECSVTYEPLIAPNSLGGL